MKLTPMMLKLSKLMAKSLKTKSYNAHSWMHYTGKALTATNGHWCIQAQLEDDACEAKLIAVDACIPAYELHDVESSTLDDAKGKPHKVHSKSENGMYPDVGSYMSVSESKTSVCFNREYLIQVLSLYDCNTIRLELKGDLDPMHLYGDDTHAVIMPMRKQ